jgi:hypothetical protein
VVCHFAYPKEIPGRVFKDGLKIFSLGILIKDALGLRNLHYNRHHG